LVQVIDLYPLPCPYLSSEEEEEEESLFKADAVRRRRRRRRKVYSKLTGVGGGFIDCL